MSPAQLKCRQLVSTQQGGGGSFGYHEQVDPGATVCGDQCHSSAQEEGSEAVLASKRPCEDYVGYQFICATSSSRIENVRAGRRKRTRSETIRSRFSRNRIAGSHDCAIAFKNMESEDAHVFRHTTFGSLLLGTSTLAPRTQRIDLEQDARYVAHALRVIASGWCAIHMYTRKLIVSARYIS